MQQRSMLHTSARGAAVARTAHLPTRGVVAVAQRGPARDGGAAASTSSSAAPALAARRRRLLAPCNSSPSPSTVPAHTGDDDDDDDDDDEDDDPPHTAAYGGAHVHAASNGHGDHNDNGHSHHMPPPPSTSSYVHAAPSASWSRVAGGAHHALPRRGSLARRIRSCESVESLAQLWRAARAGPSSAGVGPLELAILFNQLARLWDADRLSPAALASAKALMRELLIASEDRMPDMGASGFVIVIAALARANYGPLDTAWLNRWLAVSRGRLGALEPAQLATCLRALVKLQPVSGDVRTCIAFPAWMAHLVASLRPRLAGAGGSDLARVAYCLGELQYKVERGFLAELAAAVQPKLDALDAGALVRLLQSFAALRHAPDAAFMRAFYSEVYHQLPLFDDRDLARAMCTFAGLRGAVAADFLADFLTEVGEKLPGFKPEPLGHVLLALGTLRYAPPPAWVDAVGAHVAEHLPHDGGSAAAATASLWGLSRIGYAAPPALLDTYLGATYGRLSSLRPADYVRALQALAAWRWRPEPGTPPAERWPRWLDRLCHLASRKHFEPRQACDLLDAAAQLGAPLPPDFIHRMLSMLRMQGRSASLLHMPPNAAAPLLASLAALHYHPGQQWLETYANMLRIRAGALSARELSVVAAQLARMRFAPHSSRWTAAVLAHVHSRCAEFDAPSAAGLVWGFAHMMTAPNGLGVPSQPPPPHQQQLPSGRWADHFAQRVATADGGMAMLSAPQLAQALWGLAAIGHAPGEAWLAAWEARARDVGWATFGSAHAAQEVAEAYVLLGRPMPDGAAEAMMAAAAATEGAADDAADDAASAAGDEQQAATLEDARSKRKRRAAAAARRRRQLEEEVASVQHELVAAAAAVKREEQGLGQVADAVASRLLATS